MERRLLGWVLAAVALAACGAPSQHYPPGTLRVEPEDAVLTLESGVAQSLDYKAIYTDDDGDDIDVTGEATFTIEHPFLGSFDRARFLSNDQFGGRTTVRAEARGTSGHTSLTIRMHTVVILPGAPADAPTMFGGDEDSGRSPSLVYPEDGVLLPPNLSELEIHYLPGSGNTLFELHFEGDATDLEVFTPCGAVGDGCAFTFDDATWMILAEAERGTDPVKVTVVGVDGADPGKVGVSEAQKMSFGAEDIIGGLYYWAAAQGAIKRYEFGRRGQSAETYLDPLAVGATQCVGCHVLSRDGTHIAVGLDLPGPAVYQVRDVASRAMIYSQGSLFGGGGSNFFAFSPDATQILTSDGVKISWRDAASGATIQDPVVAGAMPDWSPDGSLVVYARPGVSMPPGPGIANGSLEVMRFDGATFQGGDPLVPFDGQNNYYPAISPDGQWVMFNRSPSNQGSYDAPDAEVWVVSTNGGDPIHLANASWGGDSWPKWAPNVQMWHGHTLLWFTFSSRRDFGLRTPDGSESQLWMAAFDPSRASSENAGDGSFPAFRLPFQELASGNHIAQWVTIVERPPCFEDSDCPMGELCEGGLCVGQDVD